MKKMARLIAREKKFQDRFAHGDIQVEGAVHKFELLHTARQQLLQLAEQDGQGNLPHGNVQRGQAKLAGKRAPARCLHVNDAMRDIVLGVKIVRQRQP